MGDLLLKHGPDGCTELTFSNRARRNAIDDAMLDDLLTILRRLGADPQCHMLLFRGDGGDFCSGRDISGPDIESRTDHELRADIDRLRTLSRLLNDFPQPTLAVVRGHALGLGAAIVGWCDVAFADTAAVFGFPEIKIGVPPSFTMLSLVRRVGRKAAMPLLLTAKTIDGAEAERIGLVSRCWSGQELDEAVSAFVRDAGALSGNALRRCKSLVRNVDDLTLGEALDAVLEATVIALRTADAREGRAAFREKRRPAWTERID